MPSSINPWIDPDTRDAMMRGIRRFVERGDAERLKPERLARLLEDNSMPEPNSGCLLWTGRVASAGYGRLTINRKAVSAHRLAYEVAKGPIAPGLCVCHKCDVRTCVNPDHLWLGDSTDNNADMDAKGRRGKVVGERHPRAKLTAADVIAIRADSRTNAALAEAFGVAWCTIDDVKKRRKWRHI